jgi:putative C-S lyase
LHEAVDQGAFGYYQLPDRFLDSVIHWEETRHGNTLQREWLRTTPGVVTGLYHLIRAITQPGDGVMILPPVYYPFYRIIRQTGRTVVCNYLKEEQGVYTLDLEDFEAKLRSGQVKVFLLCSPHNPVGRVWTAEELTAVADICLKNNVMLVSDEIHFDITRTKHTCLPTLGKEYANNCVVCTAVSKTFNIAGLGTSNIIIPNENVRNAFAAQLATDGYTCINCCSYPATLAAYTHCDDWIDEMNSHVDENFALLDSFLKENLPQIKLFDREGTYLAWLDMSALGMDDLALEKFMIDKCGIIPDPGYWFGAEGKGFTRLDIAVPKQVLQHALEVLKEEINKL